MSERRRSLELWEGSERVAHRALLYSIGLSATDRDKPLIGIANSWSDLLPGSRHLRSLADAVKRGVSEAGGVPLEFNTIAACDGLAQGHLGMRYILPSREIICASVEIMLEAHRLDGVVMMSSCDKITPAMLMAAARVDIPAVFLPAGVMMAGSYDGRKLTLSSTREYSACCAAGEMTLEGMTRIEEAACPTLGTCSMMETANTVACLTEALGLELPQSATALAVSSAKMWQALETGRLAVRLVNEGLRPSLILTRAALENTARVGLAIGGSTNLVLHLCRADDGGQSIPKSAPGYTPWHSPTN